MYSPSVVLAASGPPMIALVLFSCFITRCQVALRLWGKKVRTARPMHGKSQRSGEVGS